MCLAFPYSLNQRTIISFKTLKNCVEEVKELRVFLGHRGGGKAVW